MMKQKLTWSWALFLVVFAVHNIEEVMRGMAAWGHEHKFFPIWTSETFTYAAIAVWLLAIGTMLATRRSQIWLRRGLIVWCAIMFANGLQHIVLSVTTQSLMPGVLTAPLLLGVCGTILYSLWKVRSVRS